MDTVKHISEVMAESVKAHGLVPASKLARIEFDGACEPKNPGGVATGGYRILVGDTVVRQCGEFYCEGAGATNNVAEYTALGRALAAFAASVQFPIQLGVETLQIVGDSQLVVNQIDGSWACNKEHLRKLRNRCRELMAQITEAGIRVSIAWIPREENEAADALSSAAYEKHTGESFPNRRRMARR
jgi:ribonuclease HI